MPFGHRDDRSFAHLLVWLVERQYSYLVIHVLCMGCAAQRLRAIMQHLPLICCLVVTHFLECLIESIMLFLCVLMHKQINGHKSICLQIKKKKKVIVTESDYQDSLCVLNTLLL